jgi:hypothetical protein
MLFNKQKILSSVYYKEPRDFVLFIIQVLVIGLIVAIIGMQLSACKKMVHIDKPVNSITTEGAFSSDVTATSAVTGIYTNLINTKTGVNFGSGAISLCTGLSSDELSKIGIAGDLLQFQTNNLSPDNANFPVSLWGSTYFAIYQANSCLEGLQKSDGVSSTVRNQLIGECKFLRAFCYFYLTNLWGDVPMPLTSDWNQTYLIYRAPRSDVYQQILVDLKDAQELLVDDYSFSNNERIRATKYAATALLARVYLYLKDWVNAETQSSVVINSTSYSLVTDLNKVFLKNSNEAILQFQPSKDLSPFAVIEQNILTQDPIYYITDTLRKSFEFNDQRVKPKNWVDTIRKAGTLYYYPYKYKIRQGTSGGVPGEYYTVLRLAEQYLIRAEARAQLDNISDGKMDLNAIRSRAGLAPIIANDKTSLLLAIEHERQVELFVEWGHRWFDLIRTNRANAVLGIIKGNNWQPTDQSYPIPRLETQKNPNLSQNDGY